MQNQIKEDKKIQKRKGTIPLLQSNGPPQALYDQGMRILTIGDGDLSFSLAIIKWLYHNTQNNLHNQNQQTSLVATTYDSLQELQKMYKHIVNKNIKQLNSFKCVKIKHQVDVNLLEKDQFIIQQVKQKGKFDRIVWNFPHAGFPEKQKGEHTGPGFQWEDNFHQRHRNIISNFFSQGKMYLNQNGFMIMTHKTIEPFSLWNIPKLGENNGLTLVKSIPFNIDDYPGYQNRRGAGKCAGKKFPCQDALTYVFEIDKKKQ